MKYPVIEWEKWYSAQAWDAKTDYGYHGGEDLNLKTGGNSDLGQPLLAIADGEVTHTESISTGFGTHIHIKHEGAWGTVWCHYAHCQELFVKAGDLVKEGQKVATLGSSGNSAHAHCHWEIKVKPAGVRGIAKTKEELLDKWIAPIPFVQKWIKEPEPVITKPSVGKVYTEEQYKTLQGENQINWDKWQAELKARNEDIETLCKAAGCDNTFPALKARIDSWEKEKEKDRQTIGKLEDELKDVSVRETAHVKQIDELQKAIEQQRLDNELKVSSLVDQLDILKAKITQTQEKKNWLDQLLSYFKG